MAGFSLRQQEKILQMHRSSGWLLLRPLAITVVAIFVPLYPIVKYNLLKEFWVLALIWLLIWLGYFQRQFMLWWLKRYIITDQRLIKIFYEDVFKKNVQETPLDRILNVSYRHTGLCSSLLNYGDVEVQAVGLAELMKPLDLDGIDQPEQIKEALWQLHRQYTQSHPHTYKAEQNVVNPMDHWLGRS